ncbi:phenazine biosynthesis protein PhzF family [Formivibrio citricus]|uniref:Phenazine biosynthesis protein PhzF family n=1 Tax=Formivibrio citricus TaxID=83765 RepID=A0A1I4Y559_9NEIS|nr:PhzF family phenazine biosynthesis protein [Formivibrio citricus]SFN33211.1 phenazine biosynthesis protein PhzF family [Formivibrio citricus]
MQIPVYQIDAFASRVFSGNPAAVCLLGEWLPDLQMQRIAAENNLSETVFVVPRGDEFELRWFSPRMEIDLCGHATLAAAHVLFLERMVYGDTAVFHFAGGRLQVTRRPDGKLAMRFPCHAAQVCERPPFLEAALGVDACEILASRDYLVVLRDEEQVASLRPNMALLGEIRNCLGVIVTAPGRSVDFVSRFFAPNAGIPEDPVTGSAHCTLIPYWAKRLGKNSMQARQLSERGGEIECEQLEDGVLICGHAVLFMKGEIFL